MKTIKAIAVRFFNKVLCRHKWELYHRSIERADGSYAVTRLHTLVCLKCGKIKKIKV